MLLVVDTASDVGADWQYQCWTLTLLKTEYKSSSNDKTAFLNAYKFKKLEFLGASNIYA